MLLEAYLAYSLVPLFFIILGFLVYLVIRYSPAPEAAQQNMATGQSATTPQAESGGQQAQ